MATFEITSLRSLAVMSLTSLCRNVGKPPRGQFRVCSTESFLFYTHTWLADGRVANAIAGTERHGSRPCAARNLGCQWGVPSARQMPHARCRGWWPSGGQVKPPSRAPPGLEARRVDGSWTPLSSESAVQPVPRQHIMREDRWQRIGVQRSWWRSGRRGPRMRQGMWCPVGHSEQEEPRPYAIARQEPLDRSVPGAVDPAECFLGAETYG